MAAQLVSALVISRLDYVNAGLPQSSLAPLQRVLNAAARLVCDLHPRDSVTSALTGLHWLPVPARVEFKLCTIVYQSFHGSAPHYIIYDILQPVSIHFSERPACNPPPIVTCSYRVLDFGSVSEPPARQPLVSETCFRLTSEKPAPYQHLRKKTEDVLVL